MCVYWYKLFIWNINGTECVNWAYVIWQLPSREVQWWSEACAKGGLCHGYWPIPGWAPRSLRGLLISKTKQMALDLSVRLRYLKPNKHQIGSLKKSSHLDATLAKHQNVLLFFSRPRSPPASQIRAKTLQRIQTMCQPSLSSTGLLVAKEMKSVLFTIHHPKLLFILGKWLFVKLVCHILNHYLPFLSEIKADFEFSNENKSEAPRILSALFRMCRVFGEGGRLPYSGPTGNWRGRAPSCLLFLKSLSDP